MVWRQLDEPIEIAQALENMADAYGVLDHHDRALDLLKEALALTRKARAPGREANVLFSEAWIHYLRGKPAEGIPVLERVLEIRRGEGDRNGEAVALDRLGTLLREAGRLPEAEETYDSSLALSTAARSSFDATATIANLGCL